MKESNNNDDVAMKLSAIDTNKKRDYDLNHFDEKTKVKVDISHEKWYQTLIQISIPFLIAGIGTIGAGIILGRVDVR